MPTYLTAALARDVPVTPDGDEARRWAVDELSKQVYQDAKPGLLQQLWSAVLDWLRSVLGELNDINANLSLVIIVAVVLAVIAVAVWLVRPRLKRGRSTDGPVFAEDTPVTALQYRDTAAVAAGRGQWRQAVTNEFRAIVRQAEERAAIEPAPGRTAEEVARQLRGVFRDHDRALADAADLFDGVRYGAAKVGEADYSRMLDLDSVLQHSRPQYLHTADVGSGPVRPR